MPVTSNARILGITPTGVTSPKATSSTTRSPTFAPSSSASADPSITRYLPSVRSLIRPLDKCGAKSTTRRSASGSTPRTSTPDDLSPWISMPCSSIYGAAPTTPGKRSSFSRSGRQFVIRPSSPEIVACAVRLKIRVRNTSSKPFITDSTTISTATPSARPSIAMPAISDREPRLGDARRYRRPTNPSYQ